nr:hypothetical protein [candidate division Zixibacteria bacterium]
MRQITKFEPNNIKPDHSAVLAAQGVPKNNGTSPRIEKLADDAINIFLGLCDANAIISDISPAHFDQVYRGEGKNEKETPVAEIFPHADHLALFAITVGENLSTRIEQLFRDNDFALGAMLDAAASEATELAGKIAERKYLDDLINNRMTSPNHVAVRYSPGYCGWHISGQKKLFEYLYPNEIGIYLNHSYLMKPLKSISGVILVGPPDIHDFEITYDFCNQCRDMGCRERIRTIMGRG